MALDGIFLYKLKEELKLNIGAHIDKIHQPSRDELVLLLRSKEGAKRLIISLSTGRVRLNITENKAENPEKPPMFCMLLRKYLGAARLCDIKQNGFERILTLTFSSTNEMGDVIYPSLVCEMISSKPNVILCAQDGRIIDSLRHSSLETSERLILPGAIYTPPANQSKLSITETDVFSLAENILSNSTVTLSKALLKTLDGFSPLVCNELAFRVCGDVDIEVSALNQTQKMNLIGQLNCIKDEILNKKEGYLLTDEKGEIKDFCFTNITHFGKSLTNTKIGSLNELLDAFFIKRENTARIKKESEDILRLISNLYSRTSKKLLLREKELESCKNREHLRIYGELIKANLYRIDGGMSSCELENYYDENLSTITVPLETSLSPAQNADRYFKEYKKSFNAERTLSVLIEEDKKELLYYDSILDSLSRVENIGGIQEIREELRIAGLVKSAPAKPSKKKNEAFCLHEFEHGGFKILVGKNNRQNDYLTLQVANKEDIWLHTKNIPGSHVIIICGGKTPSDETLYFAAQLAAYHSKAQNSLNVAVDYTLAKFVKKPSGAKPGMVIYSKNKTLFVTPLSK